MNKNASKVITLNLHRILDVFEPYVSTHEVKVDDKSTIHMCVFGQIRYYDEDYMFGVEESVYFEAADKCLDEELPLIFAEVISFPSYSIKIAPYSEFSENELDYMRRAIDALMAQREAFLNAQKRVEDSYL